MSACSRVCAFKWELLVFFGLGISWASVFSRILVQPLREQPDFMKVYASYSRYIVSFSEWAQFLLSTYHLPEANSFTFGFPLFGQFSVMASNGDHLLFLGPNWATETCILGGGPPFKSTGAFVHCPNMVIRHTAKHVFLRFPFFRHSTGFMQPNTGTLGNDRRNTYG